jgi:hypothetical protein
MHCAQRQEIMPYLRSWTSHSSELTVPLIAVFEGSGSLVAGKSDEYVPTTSVTINICNETPHASTTKGCSFESNICCLIPRVQTSFCYAVRDG